MCWVLTFDPKLTLSITPVSFILILSLLNTESLWVSAFPASSCWRVCVCVFAVVLHSCVCDQTQTHTNTNPADVDQMSKRWTDSWLGRWAHVCLRACDVSGCVWLAHSQSASSHSSGGQTPRRDLEKVLTGEEKWVSYFYFM